MITRSRMARKGSSIFRRTTPLPSFRRPGRIGLLVLLAILGSAPGVPAQGTAPIPAFDGRHVYVGPGLPDRYGSVSDRIAQLERSASPSYYVVVLRSIGPKGDRTSTSHYVDALYETWRDQAKEKGLTLDPERSVVVVLAIEDHRVEVHPGTALRSLGLRDAIEQQLLTTSGFRDLARAEKYPEAVAALLDSTNGWILQHDPTARRSIPAQKAATPAVVGSSAPVEARGGSSGGDVAVGLGLSLLVIVAAIAGLVWMAHRRARGRLDQRIKEIRSQTTDLMDRLDALKEWLKLLPATDPDFQKPMTGQTAALYAAVQESVGKLWDRWLQVMDALDRAEKLGRSVTSPFQRKALHDAEAALEQKGVFEEIDAGVRSSSADMDRLNQAHEAARGELETVVGARPKLDAHVEAIRKLGLPIEPYQAEVAAIAAEADKARDLIAADPIGARSMLEAIRSRGEALGGRVERVAGLTRESQEVASALEGLRRQVVDHRAKGLRLDEEGGNPDESLTKAEQAHAAAVSALRAGDPDAAAQGLETSGSTLEQAQGLIEQVRVARDYCRREQPERARATERLRAALPHAESDLHRLEREFAPSSWEGAARNLDQVRELLASFDRLTADAAEASSDGAQRYLAAAGLLRQLAQRQQEALRLMSRLGDQVNALTAMRDECRRRRGEMETLGRRVEGYFRQHSPLVSTMAMDLLDHAGRGRNSVQAAFEQPRPDWPSLRDGLAKAIESYSVAQDQAEVDVRSHQQLAEAYERARAELERVADLLAGRREDRLAANQRFRSAAEVLDQVGLDLSQPHGEWPRLLDEIQGAAGDIEQAERLAREDIRLAGQAQSELEEAARSIDQARSYDAMGVGADTSHAEAALARAEQLLGAQQYEQAIASAGQAQRAARRAQQEAVQQASWRQMQADADRRRWEPPPGGSGLGDALTTGAAVAAGVFLGNVLESAAGAASHEPSPSMPEPPPAPEPMISPPPAPPESAVGTWEGDSAQGTW